MLYLHDQCIDCNYASNLEKIARQIKKLWYFITATSQERHSISNQRPFECLFNSLLGPTSKKPESFVLPGTTIHSSLRCYWPFVRGSTSDFPHKGPVTRTETFP